eukprot:CAMPEP_0177560302 /NCGR_PEP_ID=MMETSP0369-20130122/71307_1 /TAXON_ID=447022 ORGANISM="Scrippsiella hangoei-like, Strain SHHI-4" /NCGR_SAMPLE_ID=MMETSP0369 /ASSEMBLY_ACC=CAM_ASM_000364 /LENGTH=41 /DNA_ID= /DNA_START= /DNA_END= /DNA_ORIENTATION=
MPATTCVNLASQVMRVAAIQTGTAPYTTDDSGAHRQHMSWR